MRLNPGLGVAHFQTVALAHFPAVATTGTGSVELELQFGREGVPFSFHIVLDGDLKPKEVLDLKLDLEDLEA